MKRLLFCLLLLAQGYLFAQETQVSGTVTSSEDGLPLPGASILVQGTTKGTVTDFDGNYSLDNVPADATLVFSYVGFVTQEIPLNGQTQVDIALETDSQQLDEVVIVGYTQERKVEMTGAISVVDLAPLEGQSMSSGSTMQALQGRVPGLFVEKSGDPTGASNRILIRGVSTLGDNNPLYVIDGVPTVRPEVFASINPSTIESVQVLKDASASSVYGARAANGVIVISTKNRSRGEGEKFTVNINSNISVLSEKKQRYDMLNARQRGEVLWRASVNDGADPNNAFGEIYDFDWNGDLSNPVLNSVAVQPYVGGNTDVPAGDTDWQKETYETGYVYNNDVSISGGTDKSFMLLNLGYLKNTGILKYTGYERYSAKFNGNIKLFDDKVKVGVNTQFYTSNETLASPDVGSAPTPGLAITLAPTLPVFTSTGEYAGPLGSGYSDRNNPVYMQYINRWDNTKRTTFFGNVFAEINILKNLTFRTSLGIDHNRFHRKDIETTVDNGFITRATNRLTHDTNDYSSLTFTNTLNYNLETGDHKIGVLLGTEAIKTDLNSIRSSAQDFAIETEDYFTLGAASGKRTTDGTVSGSRLWSLFGKVNYAFAGKYLASFTLRRDGSSRFGEDNRYGYFPAATAGWRINRENFLSESKLISDLKIRAGYGKVGNQSIGDVARFGLFEARYGPNQNVYMPDFFNIYYNVGTAYDLNGVNTGNLPSGFVSIQAANSGLKWEETGEVNIGLDFGLLQNKIAGSFDYFVRNTEGILIQPPVASVLGEGKQRFLNGASTRTKGWELSLAYSGTYENGLYFAVSTNFGAFKDEITELPEKVRTAYPGTAENSIVGHSQFSIFGYKTDGLFQSQEEVNAHASQVGARPGGIRFVDLNNDGIINANDRDFLGTTLPDLEYGIRIDLAYKNFDFSVFGSGVTGRIGLDPYIFWNNFVQSRENAGLGVLNAWTPENTNTDIPSLSLVNNDSQTSDYLFRNNSYFKLRNMQLGYSLPKELIEKWAGMTNLRFYVQGENLFWITPDNYIGSDPERTDVNAIPVPTTFSMGVNIGF
ncbi:SusC/RagA family TonB-linked outer membrane protein [Sinomicrobium weinanense]|uniref:TonB-dependent receptor n=1 Tax=Sinomicrobium weinanense TaxID=2842200 RepID=A0A926Q3L0_9FLAO|nr:TonB-dependent receptor [Sinomicrobium weinanense]MBC9796121.1 TonB-dependent receptor [Sinomicrobium weinanense]MBU3124790.1 TonB-dependent receptor [Sinomicrobium weinanense]